MPERGARSSFKKVWVVLSLALVFSSADLVRLNPREFDVAEYSAYRYAGLAVGFGALLAAAGVAWLRTQHHVTPLLLVWLLLGSLLFVSAVLNESAAGIYGSLWYLVGVPVVCVAAIPRLLRSEGEQLLAWALLVGDVPMLAVSLARYPLQYPFMGVTGNPNSIGVLAATIGVAFLALLGGALRRFRWGSFLFLALGLFGSVVLTLASGSRTSALALLAAALPFAFDWFRGRSGWLQKTFGTVAMVALLACGVALARDQSASSVAGIFSKNDEGRSTFVPQRGEIWRQTIAEAATFGHGENYFEERFIVSAHNSIIGVCGQYGALPAMVFVIFGGAGLISAWRHYQSRRGHAPDALTPLLLQVCFWGLSMGEGMFGLVAGSINVAFLIAFGMTQYRGHGRVAVRGRTGVPSRLSWCAR